MNRNSSDPDPVPAGGTLPDPAAGFPAPVEGGGRSRRRSLRRIVAGGAAAGVLLVGGVAAAGTREPSTGGYRTAAAGTRTVDRLLDAVATVEPVSQASVAFPVDGTVAIVSVKPGDDVVVGQMLGTLDTDALEDTLDEKRAALDQAELLLERALAGEDVSGPAGQGQGIGTTGISYPATTDVTSTAAAVEVTWATWSTGSADPAVTPVAYSTSGQESGADDELRAAQQAVLDAQKQVDEDLNTAQTALDSAVQICAAVGTPVESGTDGTEADADGASDVAACRDALQIVIDAQRVVADDQAKVVDASTALTTLLDERAAQPDTTTPDTTAPAPDTTSPSSSTPSRSGASDPGTTTGTDPAPSGTGSGASAAAQTTSPSAEQLVAYQKDIDAAASQVTVAEQAVGQASIVSPIDGTVVAVDLAVGDAVTAASSTAAVVVVGDGGYEVTTNVSVDDLPDVEVGQATTVTPDGGDRTVQGEVVGIGVAAVSSGSTTSYPVTIGLTGDTADLNNGATASVSIVTDASEQALAVPTSAVTVEGDRHTIDVVDGDATKTVTVDVGVVGDTWTEITDGLTAGQEVVLADLDEPLPGSATETSSSGEGQGQGGGEFQFPGGGPPAGFRPGGN